MADQPKSEQQPSGEAPQRQPQQTQTPAAAPGAPAAPAAAPSRAAGNPQPPVQSGVVEKPVVEEQPVVVREPLAEGHRRFMIVKPLHYQGQQRTPAKPGNLPELIDIAGKPGPVILAFLHFRQVVEIGADGKPLPFVQRTPQGAAIQPRPTRRA